MVLNSVLLFPKTNCSSENRSNLSSNWQDLRTWTLPPNLSRHA